MTTNNDSSDLPIDPTHKLNKPEPFDLSQFGGIEDLAKMKLEPKAKPAPEEPKKAKGKKESAPVEPQDEATLLANPPKVEGQKSALFAAGSEQIRNAITKLLEKEWPEAYAHYRAIKYQTPGVEPSLAQRKLAYEFAFRAFLTLTYRKSFAEGQG